jgi:hypothetical protein
MDTLSTLGTLTGLGLLAGFRLYATVLAVGIGLRLGVFQLHSGLEGLSVLASPFVLAPAAVVYGIEFLADKIPWVDSLWDSFHTFVRPLGAALIGATAVGSVDPAVATGAALLCGAVALTGHSTKAGARLVVNHSPEPFTNVGMSLAEDAMAIGGTWLAVQHPQVMLGVVVGFLVLFAWLAPKLFRLLRILVSSLGALFTRPVAVVPPAYLERIGLTSQPECVRCVAGKGVPRLKHSIGYLCLLDGGPVYVAKRWRVRDHRIDPARVEAAEFKSGILMHRLTLTVDGKEQRYDFPKTRTDVRALLRRAFPGVSDRVQN